MQPDDDNTQAVTVLCKGTVINHYRIVEKIGSGGMGEVYLAEDPELDRRVVLKFLTPKLRSDPEFITRFRREAQAAAQINHPNVATIYEVGEHCGYPFIAMEYLSGETLQKLLDKERSGLAAIVELVAQIAEGLSSAHQAGVVHRDIKPANILMDREGRPKIVDFGLAIVKNAEHLTKAGSTIGTIAYMSPEQALGETIDHRSDLFSLGVVFYEMLTQHLPFLGDTDAATLHKITLAEPEPVTSYRVDAPQALALIVSRLLQKDPSHRYQSAAELASDLRQWEATGAMPTQVALPRKPGRRDKAKVTALTALVVLSIAAVYWFFHSKEPSEGGKQILAILPFENLGPPDQEYFADGLTEEILSRLSCISDLGVISRGSTIQYKNNTKNSKKIGSDLGANYIVEGAVRWDTQSIPNKVRISAQLIRTKDAVVVWSRQYDEVFSEILRVQSNIAERVALGLNPALKGSDYGALTLPLSESSEAYDFSLRGKQYFQDLTREGLVNAEEMYNKAITLDPGFALAYAMLGRVHTEMYWWFYDRSDERLRKAEQKITKALELAPDLPEAHAALGYFYYHGKLDYDSALIQFKEASTRQPGNGDLLEAIALVQRRKGLWKESVAGLEQAVVLSPRDASLRAEIAATLISMRSYAKADSQLAISLQISPDLQLAYYHRFMLFLLWKGDTRAARQVVEEALRRNQLWWGMVRYELLADVIEEKYDQALSRLDKIGQSIGSAAIDIAEFHCRKGDIYRYQHRTEPMRTEYDSARITLEKALRDDPKEAWYHALLGRALAGLGEREKAISEARLAVNLLPVTKDAFDGTDLIGQLAETYMLVGEFDAAIDQLAIGLGMPSFMSVPLLRVWPEYKPLANVPRFQSLLAEYQHDGDKE